jgi:geranylgeranyl pyrophosphate synthase
MIQYANEAVSLLLKYPEGEVRNALERLVVYVISRDK